MVGGYDLEGLDGIGGLRRPLEIATADVIPVDQPIPAPGAPIAAVGAGPGGSPSAAGSAVMGGTACHGWLTKDLSGGVALAALEQNM